ncbi:MAG: pilus assembly protein PilM [Candidatus Omnitrophica bacterium]|nr:pilus assembly protein PilM [Candidatus Omnitrophota bacterium]
MAKNIFSVIEITDSHVKMVQSRIGRTPPEIIRCQIRQIHNFTDEELQKHLTELLSNSSVREDQMRVIIPRRLCILKHLEFPSEDPREIQQMLDIQLVSQMPYALDEVIYKYQVLEQTTSGTAKVLVVIVHREIIKKYLQLFTAIGFRVSDLTYSSFGLNEWWSYQLKADNLLEDLPVLLLNIDYSGSELAFCSKGKVWFSRNIDPGFKHLANGNWFEFENQIQLSLASYNKAKMGPEIKQIKIISASVESEKLSGYLKEKFRLPVNVAVSSAYFSFDKKINVNQVEQQGISVSAALGSLISSAAGWFNLVPKEIGEQKHLKARRIELIKLLFLLGVLFGLWIGYEGLDLFFKSKTLAKVQVRVDQVKPLLKDQEKKQALLEALKDQEEKRIFMPELLASIQKLVTNEISLRSLSIDGQRNLVIMGYAESGTAVNMFQGRLVQSKQLKDVSLQFATKRRIYNMELTDFKIIAKIKNK